MLLGGTDWPALPYEARNILANYNSSIHAATGFTPYELMFGSQPSGLAVHELLGAGLSSNERLRPYARVVRDVRRDIQKEDVAGAQRTAEGRSPPPRVSIRTRISSGIVGDDEASEKGRKVGAAV